MTFFFKITLLNPLVSRFDLTLILCGDVVWIPSESIARIHGVHFAENPILPLQMTVTDRNALADIIFFLEALAAHYTLNKRLLGAPANRLLLLLHDMNKTGRFEH